MGCDGHTPNVICPNRINPIVQPWLAALPMPTSSGPKNNYLAPALPDSLSNADYFMWRYDLQLGTKDHMFASFYRQLVPVIANSQLPQPIASEVILDPANRG